MAHYACAGDLEYFRLQAINNGNLYGHIKICVCIYDLYTLHFHPVIQFYALSSAFQKLLQILKC